MLVPNIPYEKSVFKQAGIGDDITNAIKDPSLTPALVAGGVGALGTGYLASRTPKGKNESTAHRIMRILGNAAVGGAATGGATLLGQKAYEQLSTVRPTNDRDFGEKTVDAIHGFVPFSGKHIAQGVAMGGATIPLANKVSRGIAGDPMDNKKSILEKLNKVEGGSGVLDPKTTKEQLDTDFTQRMGPTVDHETKKNLIDKIYAGASDPAARQQLDKNVAGLTGLGTSAPFTGVHMPRYWGDNLKGMENAAARSKVIAKNLTRMGRPAITAGLATSPLWAPSLYSALKGNSDNSGNN